MDNQATEMTEELMKLASGQFAVASIQCLSLCSLGIPTIRSLVSHIPCLGQGFSVPACSSSTDPTVQSHRSHRVHQNEYTDINGEKL